MTNDLKQFRKPGIKIRTTSKQFPTYQVREKARRGKIEAKEPHHLLDTSLFLGLRLSLCCPLHEPGTTQTQKLSSHPIRDKREGEKGKWVGEDSRVSHQGLDLKGFTRYHQERKKRGKRNTRDGRNNTASRLHRETETSFVSGRDAWFPPSRCFPSSRYSSNY